MSTLGADVAFVHANQFDIPGGCDLFWWNLSITRPRPTHEHNNNPMTIDEALGIMIERTGHERYRWLCLEQPDPIEQATWRNWIIEQAISPNYPPIATQAQTFLSAVKDWVKAGLPVADRAERMRRRSICEICPLFDGSRKRCTKCGCKTALKPWLLTETCPDGRWESA